MEHLAVCVLLFMSISAAVEFHEDAPLLFESKYQKAALLTKAKVTSIKEALGNFFKPQPVVRLTDSGKATSCGGLQKFNLTWTPKIVNPSRGVMFNLQMIAAADFSSGQADVAVYTDGSSEPFITDSLPLNCAIMNKLFKNLCPIKTGAHIDVKYDQPDLTALPPGSYKLTANITGTKGQCFMCAQVIVTIEG
ncbi:uncharacterized protein LOC124285302 [Haliotis rubra]|uniref:uncharacterized protein LOC124285302 n=1 Tax=Haliotis rubra TaxID=36100 RepID=UPI001EE5E99F|nr:uncharacterized protein LOC124285302 [Haliotis rubra]XP_046577476.1 uncharacterized protein LOC124285302 [Haliotis rubra]